MSKISRVEIIAFRFPLADMSLGDHSATGVGNIIYKKGASTEAERFAVRITCDDGISGEYVNHWVGTPSTFGQTRMLCPHLIGPGMMNSVPPVYLCGYSDQAEDLSADGTVPVPDGPGLGVVYDWDYIMKHKTDMLVFE